MYKNSLIWSKNKTIIFLKKCSVVWNFEVIIEDSNYYYFFMVSLIAMYHTMVGLGARKVYKQGF